MRPSSTRALTVSSGTSRFGSSLASLTSKPPCTDSYRPDASVRAAQLVPEPPLRPDRRSRSGLPCGTQPASVTRARTAVERSGTAAGGDTRSKPPATSLRVSPASLSRSRSMPAPRPASRRSGSGGSLVGRSPPRPAGRARGPRPGRRRAKPSAAAPPASRRRSPRWRRRSPRRRRPRPGSPRASRRAPESPAAPRRRAKSAHA